ncbi:anthranilate synthase component 1 [Colletotrichum chrysophilum]|uniref:Anthranilate synthase component 1 n=1 Tax=Colletotrichum chrysophilum TaxID=1836956 RepID=A0AAD9A0F6_9PEZI|nr:anthranilate synthase component 1 [Colletotrichum chrysophilum]
MRYQLSSDLGSTDNALSTVFNLIHNLQPGDYQIYERGDVWHIGLGCRSSLTVSPCGDQVTLVEDGDAASQELQGPISDVARTFVQQHIEFGVKVYGYASFNYAAHTLGQFFEPGTWPLLRLMVPQIDVSVGRHSFTVSGYDMDEIRAVSDIITSPGAAPVPQPYNNISVSHSEKEYEEHVCQAVSEIVSKEYEKVIVSRVVELPHEVDIPGTLLRGQQANCLSRSFAMSHDGFEAAGFSPELVMRSAEGEVATEPLAGTRSCEGLEEEIRKLRNELLNDPKEIYEHTISVREVIGELRRLCEKETVVVKNFMSPRVRGGVQHLASTVQGTLAPDKDMWNAFDVLFPSVTATGVPKRQALRAIQRLEPRARELYSGAVLLVDGETSMEAALVLRTVFQQQSRQWIQVGAGIVAQSSPAREVTETLEKLASIAPYVATKVNKTRDNSGDHSIRVNAARAVCSRPKAPF